jgi:hypothetical protein
VETRKTSSSKSSEGESDHEKKEITNSKEDNQIITVTRNSSDDKKLPVTRSDDFYGKSKYHQTNQSKYT